MKTKKIIIAIITLTLTCSLYWINTYYKFIAVNTPHNASSAFSNFTLMTYNVAYYDSTRFTPSVQAELLEIIEQEKPDILCSQELSFESLSKVKNQLDNIYGSCEALANDSLWRLRFYSRYPLRNFNRHRCHGDIQTSDMTEKESLSVKLLQKQMNVMSAEFEVSPGHWVKLFSGHLRSSAYSTARRSMNKDASWFDGISLYKRNYEVGKRIRDYEAENVRRYIDTARNDGMPVIVAGDLNDWCGSDCLNTLMGSKSSRSSKVPGSNDQLKDAWWEGGNGFGWTYFGWHLRLRLDHILFSDELELVDVKVIDTDLSDHKPLMAKFRFK